MLGCQINNLSFLSWVVVVNNIGWMDGWMDGVYGLPLLLQNFTHEWFFIDDDKLSFNFKKKNLSITDQILIRKTKYDNVVDDDDVFAKTKKTTDIII